MTVPDPGEQQPEQLAGGDGPRVRWTAVAVVAVLAAGGIALAQAVHHDPRHTPKHSTAQRHQASVPVPVPTDTATTPTVHVGSVFLEHLPGCTHTDHRHRLSVALGVTNLSANPLLLVDVTPVSSNAVLVQPISVRVGRAGCARPPIARPVRLGPADNAVVEIDFRVGTVCPKNTLVSATVAFDGGPAGLLHADSSELANLDKLDFNQCA